MKTISCADEKKARLISSKRNDGEPYPVYYFKSETSGEKLYEEFYSESDSIDEENFFGLGIIKNAIKPSILNIENIINELKMRFNSDMNNKESIIEILKKYLGNFEHKETGKALDNKM